MIRLFKTMMSFFRLQIRRPNPLAGWMVVIGLVAGGISGWIAAYAYLKPMTDWINRPRTETVSTIQKSPSYEVVPVAKSVMDLSQTPPAVLARSWSPVAAVVKKTSGDLVYSDESHAGYAIALTSGGWWVAPFSVVKGLRASDLTVVWRGKNYPVLRAVRDTLTDAVFLKTSATDMPAAAFVKPADLTAGMLLWTETSPDRLVPETLIDLRASASVDPVLSERAARRLLVSVRSETLSGGAVWDSRGQLVGMVESVTRAGLRVIPSANFRTALAGLLETGTIRHAFLGVRATDLSRLAFVTTTTQPLPDHGAWIRADKKTNVPAVSPDSPSANKLKEGDVIERIDRDVLDEHADLGELLLEYRPGSEVTITVSRRGASIDVPITLGVVESSDVIK